MSPRYIPRGFVIVVVFGFLALLDFAPVQGLSLEGQQFHVEQPNLMQQADQASTFQHTAGQQQQAAGYPNRYDQTDADEDDDEDDGLASTLTDKQQAALMQAAGNQYARQAQYQQGAPIEASFDQQQNNHVATATDLKPAASKHHHHGHGAKGWLDMGAWTGKKGAFGWYDKHPVGGKGK